MAEPAPLNVRSENRTAVGMESEALVAGIIAAVIGALVGGIVFAGGSPSIWGGWSIGLLAALVVLVGGVIVSYIGYWRSRHLPGQDWRLHLKPWKFILDATNVAAVHALIATIGTIAVFVLLALSFRGVVLDGWVSAAAVGAAAGLTANWIYGSVSNIDTAKLSALLVTFIALTTLTSMATASDPQWWEYHFSLLGTLGDGSANLFNISLIIAGLLVTTFSLYLHRDIESLVELGVLRYRWSARTISTLFIIMGLMLAGVGVFPLTVSVLVPVLVMVKLASRELPTATSPKLRLPLTPTTRVGVDGVGDGLVGVDESPPPQATTNESSNRGSRRRRRMAG